MVDERPGLGVVEEVDEFLLHVAVVHVERRHPGLVGAEHALEVLVAVVEVEPQVVLAGLPALEGVALGVGPEPVVGEHVGEPAGALGQLGVGEALVAPDDGLVVGDGGGDGLVDAGEVELHGVPLGVAALVPGCGRSPMTLPAAPEGR